jgi:hypothetical protein
MIRLMKATLAPETVTLFSGYIHIYIYIYIHVETCVHQDCISMYELLSAKHLHADCDLGDLNLCMYTHTHTHTHIYIYIYIYIYI